MNMLWMELKSGFLPLFEDDAESLPLPLGAALFRPFAVLVSSGSFKQEKQENQIAAHSRNWHSYRNCSARDWK